MPIFLFLDYDGTLTPIVSSPEKARLNNSARRLLKKLSSSVSVAIVSGRSLTDVRKLVRIPTLTYAGNHGLELKSPAFSWTHSKAKRLKPVLKQLNRLLQKKLRHIKGTVVENKTLTLSVHDRLASPLKRREIVRIIKETTRTYRNRKQVKLTYGKRVTEIRPNTSWGKGALVQWLFKKWSRKNSNAPLAIYIGDDRTDEEAFRTVNRKKGLSILVSSKTRPTHANYRLRSPKEVLTFLNGLLNLFGRI